MGALRGPSLQLQGAASVQEGLSGNDAALTGEEIPVPEDEASPSQDTGDIDDGPWHKKLPWDVRRKVFQYTLYLYDAPFDRRMLNPTDIARHHQK
ncbi:hypothetical protein DFQ27_004198 [Actinomortierella ambigua]|uniref:Uncharacterized protein n=1 Tax=Actinomortierella ambigua TaxID=1343610 RepID=A0A9P6U4F2_9FUNG|nr:hypothetical protein DFQ27_004198 [Actinomortierella ambigua]